MPRATSRVRAFLGRNEFLRHVSILMSGTALAQIVVMALTPVLGRLYSPEEYGIFGTFASIVAIIAAVATLKYDMAIMLPKQDDSAIILKRTVTWVSFSICLIMTLALFFLAPWIAQLIRAPWAAPWLLLAGVSAFTITEIGILGYWLNRKSRYREIASNRVLQSGSTAITQVALGFIKPLGMGGLIIGTIVGQAISIFALIRKTPEVRKGPTPTWRQRKNTLRRYRRMPLLNTPTALIDALRMNGILLLIPVVSTLNATGQFQMAWRMVEVPAALIGSALAQVFFQRLSVVERGSLLPAVRSSIKKSALFGIVPFALVFALSPWLFPLVFGAEWVDAGYFAQALVPWLFMNVITSPISTIFVVTEQQHISLMFSICFTAVPFAILLLWGHNIMFAVFVMGAAMGVMLVIYIVLAVFAARKYDRPATLAAAETE